MKKTIIAVALAISAASTFAAEGTAPTSQPSGFLSAHIDSVKTLLDSSWNTAVRKNIELIVAQCSGPSSMDGNVGVCTSALGRKTALEDLGGNKMRVTVSPADYEWMGAITSAYGAEGIYLQVVSDAAFASPHDIAAN